MKTTALAFVLCAAVASGCSNTPAADAGSAAQPAATAPAGAPAQAAAAPAAGASGAQSFTGTVVETMNAASYTYVRVKTDAGDLWAASAQCQVAVGDRVVVPIETPMENFHSPSLKRDFPVIYFASRISREGEAAPAGMPALASSHTTTGGGAMAGGMGSPVPQASAAPVVQKMPPPEGGMSVADVWARRASLAGKTVTVRGTVVKFNGAIMGRNWVHIQDGSGTAADRTHDLTITCDAIVKIGDVVTATGVIAIDKDFTAGYAYPVILEGAKVVVK